MEQFQIDVLSSLGVNLEEVLDRFVQNEALYFKCLGKFVDETNYDELLSGISNNDPKACFEAAHAIKGVTANLGLMKLNNEIAVIVEVFRVGSMDFDPGNLQRIKECYSEAVDAIKSII